MASPEQRPPHQLQLETRLRTLTACDLCKSRRRKCDGAARCSGCASRGALCIYTTNKPRGPKPQPLGVLPFHRASLPLAPYATIGVAAVLDSPGIPMLSPRDLRRVFRSQNLFVKKVDDVRFFAALDVYQKGDRGAPMPQGLRACAFALLSLLHRLDGDSAGEAAYSSWALQSVDAAMGCGERPSEHLISALVLLELSLVHAGRLEGALSGLAHHLAGFMPTACTEVAFCAGIFHKQGMFARCGVVWPPREAPVGASRAWRLADLLSFAAAHLSGAVPIDQETAPAFFALLDEAASLQHELGSLTDSFPCIPMVDAIKAVACIRLHNFNEGRVVVKLFNCIGIGKYSYLQALVHAVSAFTAYDARIHGSALLCLASIAKLLLSLPPVLHAIESKDVCRSGLCVLDEAPFSEAAMKEHFSAIRTDLAARLATALEAKTGAVVVLEPLPRSAADVDGQVYCALAVLVDRASAADADEVA